MKSKFTKTICMVILIASYVGVFFVMSIMDLTNTKDVREATIDVAGELLIVENSVNGIIPIGKDYYYIGVDADEGSIYTIHAGKNWLEQNFDEDGFAVGDGVTMKGLCKRASKYNVEKELADRVSQVASESGWTLAIVPGYVIESNYVQDAVVKLIAGVLIFAIGIIIFVSRKRSEVFPAWVPKVVLVLSILALIFAMWAIL